MTDPTPDPTSEPTDPDPVPAPAPITPDPISPTGPDDPLPAPTPAPTDPTPTPEPDPTPIPEPETPAETRLIAHARRELELRGDSNEMIEAVLAAFRAYEDIPGIDAIPSESVVAMLGDLLQYRNLTELTDDPHEWDEIGPGIWQSSRNPAAFSNDHGTTYKLIYEGYLEHNAKTVTGPTT